MDKNDHEALKCLSCNRKHFPCNLVLESSSSKSWLDALEEILDSTEEWLDEHWNICLFVLTIFGIALGIIINIFI